MKSFTRFLNEERDASKKLSSILTKLEDIRRAAQSAHWNVRGKNFLELHALFGEIYDYSNEQIDVIAERIMAIDDKTLISIEGSKIPSPSSDEGRNIDMVLKLLSTEDLTKLLNSLNETSSNMVQEIISQLDKFAWKLKSTKT